MKHLLLTLICLCAPSFILAQSKRPHPVERVAQDVASKKVTITTSKGDTITGGFISADKQSVTIEVAGNRLTLKLDEIATIHFGTPPIVTTPQIATSLTIEAGLIYSMGGNQPVARTRFHLLDKSAEDILREAGMQSTNRLPLIDEYLFALRSPTRKQAADTGARAIEPHVLKTTTTDFQGRARIEGIEPGVYYLFGWTQTRKGHAAWNVRVEVKTGENSVALDQNNAATAF